MAEDKQINIELTTEIVSAYVSNNPVAADKLSDLLNEVHSAVTALGSVDAQEPAEERQAPAVSVRKSVSENALICLECGKSFKSIKRHLGTAHGLTPAEYREKWGLKPDYPMVAPGYSKKRSKLAKKIGLGRK